jgi:hypothetical protein
MTDSTVTQPAAKPPPNWRRRCLWALPIILPLALFVQSRKTVSAWAGANDLIAESSPLDRPATLAGAEWRIVNLQRIAERPDGSAVALLRIETRVLDAESVAQPPCRITLRAPDGRYWQPSFLAPSEARRVLSRDKDAGKSCGPAFLGKPPAGSTVAITESFVLPAAAFATADVTISLPASRPRYLRFVRAN